MFRKTELRTERLVLRPWQPGDVEDAFTYASDKEWARYLWNTPWPYEFRDAEEFVTRAVANDWTTQAQFAIELEGTVIGGIRLFVIDAPVNRIAGLGYNVGRPYWNQGYVTEAATAVLDYGFEAGLQKVTATADARNVGSIRVMEKLGMTCGGLSRAQRLSRGVYVDEVQYSILSSDWRRNRT